MLLFALLIACLLSISSVFAQAGIAEEVNKGIKGFTDFIRPVASQVLGETPGGEYLFAKVLFWILILAIVWYGLEQIDFFASSNVLHWIVSIVVAILATRWIASDTLIRTIILPYTTLGIVIAVAVPFVIFFAIVELGMSGLRYKTIRKIAWILFAVVFIGLWIVRYDKLGNAGWIYPVTVLAAIIVLLFDGTIQHIWGRMKVDKSMSITDYKIYSQTLNQIEELKHTRKDLLNKPGIKQADLNKISAQIKRLTKEAAEAR